jgi:hypothetical protein
MQINIATSEPRKHVENCEKITRNLIGLRVAPIVSAPLGVASIQSKEIIMSVSVRTLPSQTYDGKNIFKNNQTKQCVSQSTGEQLTAGQVCS